MKSNAERAKQWIRNCDFDFALDDSQERKLKTLIALLDAVRLDEAEWWLRLVDGLELDEETAAHERIAELRANSNGNQAK